MLVAGQRLDVGGGHGVAGDRAQGQAVAAEVAGVRQDAVVAGVDAQRVHRDVQRGVVQGHVAAHGDVVAGAGLRDGQAGVAGLEVVHGVVHRQVAVDDEVAVGDAGGGADGIARRDARVARDVEVAVDRAEARDGGVRGRIDVAAERDARAAAVAADHQRAAVDVDAAGEAGRAVEYLRIAWRNRQVGGHDARAIGRAKRDRRCQPFFLAIDQNVSPFGSINNLMSDRY